MYFVRFKNSVFIIKRNLGKLFWAVKHLIGKASGCFLMSDQDPVKKGPHVLYMPLSLQLLSALALIGLADECFIMAAYCSWSWKEIVLFIISEKKISHFFVFAKKLRKQKNLFLRINNFTKFLRKQIFLMPLLGATYPQGITENIPTWSTKYILWQYITFYDLLHAALAIELIDILYMEARNITS